MNTIIIGLVIVQVSSVCPIVTILKNTTLSSFLRLHCLVNFYKCFMYINSLQSFVAGYSILYTFFDQGLLVCYSKLCIFLTYFSSCDKIPWQKLTQGERTYFGSQFKGTVPMAEESWQHELQAFNTLTPQSGNRECCMPVSIPLSSFYTVQDCSLGNSDTHSGQVFSPQLI